MKKPLIGITLDEEETKTYSNILGMQQEKIILNQLKKRGVSIFLPNNYAEIEYYLKLIDGLVVTGGDFDIDPSLYGESTNCKEIKTKTERTNFEYNITKKLLVKRNLYSGYVVDSNL